MDYVSPGIGQTMMNGEKPNEIIILELTFRAREAQESHTKGARPQLTI